MGKITNPDDKTWKKTTTAASADKHELYERSVQCAETEIDFIEATFRKLRNRPARSLREDFCGTMNNSCEWVRRHRDNRAICVDIDQSVLAWGRTRKFGALTPEQARRISIRNADVRKVRCEPVDAALALNFSYWVFKSRQDMGQYFRRVRQGLKHDGVLFLDAFGGYEAFEELEESTRYKGFTYIWDQHHYNPITGDATFFIHFTFPDGSRLDRAFRYDWRLWTLPELTELLAESGFKATVYWEGEDAKGEGNGVFKPTTEGSADAGWIVYIVAEKIA